MTKMEIEEIVYSRTKFFMVCYNKNNKKYNVIMENWLSLHEISDLHQDWSVSQENVTKIGASPTDYKTMSYEEKNSNLCQSEHRQAHQDA